VLCAGSRQTPRPAPLLPPVESPEGIAQHCERAVRNRTHKHGQPRKGAGCAWAAHPVKATDGMKGLVSQGWHNHRLLIAALAGSLALHCLVLWDFEQLSPSSAAAGRQHPAPIRVRFAVPMKPLGTDGSLSAKPESRPTQEAGSTPTLPKPSRTASPRKLVSEPFRAPMKPPTPRPAGVETPAETPGVSWSPAVVAQSVPEAPAPTEPPAEDKTIVDHIVMRDPRVLAQEKERYLSALLEHIDAHKRYPRAARRRRIQGTVTVSFTLLPSGEIRDLKAVGAPRALCRAAERSVRDSLPLPKPPQDVGFGYPAPIRYAMRFSLW
jgi:protein TonB